MSKSIDIVLSGATDGHGEAAFANQFINEVANAIGASGIAYILGNRIAQAELMFGVAKQDDSSLGGDSMIGRLNFDGTIELGLEKVTLVLIHRVIPW